MHSWIWHDRRYDTKDLRAHMWLLESNTLFLIEYESGRMMDGFWIVGQTWFVLERCLQVLQAKRERRRRNRCKFLLSKADGTLSAFHPLLSMTRMDKQWNDHCTNLMLNAGHPRLTLLRPVRFQTTDLSRHITPLPIFLAKMWTFQEVISNRRLKNIGNNWKHY